MQEHVDTVRGARLCQRDQAEQVRLEDVMGVGLPRVRAVGREMEGHPRAHAPHQRLDGRGIAEVDLDQLHVAGNRR